MKLLKKAVLAGFLLAIIAPITGTAQTASPLGYYNDPINLIMPAVQGTARIQGLGGAQAAIGGDISSIAGNPAGIGLIKHSQVTISPSLGFNNTDGQFQGKTVSDFSQNFNIGNLGVVFANPKDEIVEGDWRGGSFAIGFTRTGSFNNEFQYRGTVPTAIRVDPKTGIHNSNNSYIDYVVNMAKANGIDTNVHSAGYSAYYATPSGNALNAGQSEVYQAYIANLIDYSPPGKGTRPDNIFNNYFGRLIPLGDVQQNVTVRNKGSQNQFDFSYGGNVSDKFYFGASLGITTFWHTQDISYIETQTNVKDSLYYNKAGVDLWKSYTLTRNESTTWNGQGANFKAGFILRPQNWLRLGGSVLTPTVYNINQSKSFNVSTVWPQNPGNVFPNDNNAAFNGQFSYQLITPTKWTGGAAIIFEKKGFITLDVDYLSYDKSFLKADNGALDADNDYIKAKYQSVLNIRGGAEYRNGIMAFRLGGAMAASPYKSVDNVNYINNGTSSLTAGFGVRTTEFFIDLALVHSSWKQIQTALDADGYYSPKATINQSNTNLVVTAGLLF